MQVFSYVAPVVVFRPHAEAMNAVNEQTAVRTQLVAGSLEK
jgi:hypothetical protein